MEQDGWVLDSPSTFSGFKRCNFNNDEDSNLSRKRIRATFLTQPSAHQTITASTQSLPLGGTQDDDLRYRSMDTIQQYNQIISFSQWSSKDDCTSTNSHSIALSENGGREAETRSLEPRCQMSKEEETNGKRATPVESPYTPTRLTFAGLAQGQCGSPASLGSVSPVVGDDSHLSDAVCYDSSSGSDYIQKKPASTIRRACFGVVTVNATSSFTESQGTKTTPVSVQRSGDILKLKTLDSDKYAGLISCSVLGTLLDEVNVNFIATLATGTHQSNGGIGKISKLDRPQERAVRIVIYGLKDDRYTVGNMLSDAGIFLQQPSVTECDRDTEYCNPHYLVRPGSQMPRLDALSICTDTRNAAISDQLDEVNKHRFMQIFDTADGKEIRSHIRPSGRLASTLKDHQLIALAMMIEKECGIVDEPLFPPIWELTHNSGASNKYRHRVTGISEGFPIPVYGGILADDMGLGKTLSILALICSSLDILDHQDSPSLQAMSRATLIVVPKSTIPGWQQQIMKHINPGKLRVAVYHGSARRRISTCFSSNDIVLTTYETLRSDWITSGPLYSENWYRLVLDEAHHIRNRTSQAFKATCAVLCQYRWCLTGTPIHNSLDDYGALLSFIGVSPFTEKSLFDYWIMSPIKNGRAESFKRLQKLVTATCLRRTKKTAGLSLALPQRIEEIDYIQLYPADQNLYDFFKAKTAKIAAGMAPLNEATSGLQTKENKILVLINFLRLICNHGTQLLPGSAVEAWKDQDSAVVDWQLMQNFKKRCDICGEAGEPELLSPSNSYISCMHTLCGTCASANTLNTTEDEKTCPKCVTEPDCGTEATAQSTTLSIPPSAKIQALLKNLESEQTQSERTPGAQSTPEKQTKSVVFSFWTKMLDMIQEAVMLRGYKFQRIDGRTSLEGRRQALIKFNEDPKCTILLASIGSAGEGVDLTVANHVHLIEPHWNPMAEAQAVDRVHRIGQVRDVIIRRYIVRNSIETYIQWVQQHKMKLISRSLDCDDVSQSDLDDERWKTLRLHLNHPSD